jgi:hypothetical protein
MRRISSATVVLDQRLPLRDKLVAAGLALGTAMVLVMMGLGAAYAAGLVLLAPLLATRPVRNRVFAVGCETFAAYYVAWLYGPLGWGVYRNSRWAQVLGIGTIAFMLARAAIV